MSSYEKIVTLFDTAAHAEAAKTNLAHAGFSTSDMSIVSGQDLPKSMNALREPGLWHRLFGSDIEQHEATVYAKAVESGGVVLSVRAAEADVPKAMAILNQHALVDVSERQSWLPAQAPDDVPGGVHPLLHRGRRNPRHERAVDLNMRQIADHIDVVVSGNGQLRLDQRAAGAVEGHTERLRQRRGGDARGPEDRPRVDPLRADADSVAVDPRDLDPGPDGHAELLELSAGRVRQAQPQILCLLLSAVSTAPRCATVRTSKIAISNTCPMTALPSAATIPG